MRTTLAFLLIVLSSAVSAEEFKKDHKCYVIDTDGLPHIYFMWIKPSERLTKAAQLPGKPILDSYSKPKAEIESVEQCILEGKSFASAAARMLDKHTER